MTEQPKRKPGRPPGARNKKTLERKLHQRAVLERNLRLHDEFRAQVESGKLPSDDLTREVLSVLDELAHPEGPQLPRPLERSSSPLDVMLESMWVALDRWKYPRPGQNELETLKAAELAVEAAAKAAPFVHPRLAASAVANVTPPGQDAQLTAFETARRVSFLLSSGLAEVGMLPLPDPPKPKPVQPEPVPAESAAREVAGEVMPPARDAQRVDPWLEENNRPDNRPPPLRDRYDLPRVLTSSPQRRALTYRKG